MDGMHMFTFIIHCSYTISLQPLCSECSPDLTTCSLSHSFMNHNHLPPSQPHSLPASLPPSLNPSQPHTLPASHPPSLTPSQPLTLPASYPPSLTPSQPHTLTVPHPHSYFALAHVYSMYRTLISPVLGIAKW